MSFGPSRLGKPSAEQERRWEKMRAAGCIACSMAVLSPQGGRTEIHHLTIGGKHGAPRLGHWQTVALCAWHHRGMILDDIGLSAHMEVMYGPSYARTPKAFRAEYGNDALLLEYQNELIGWTAEAKPLSDERSTLEVSRTTQKKRRGSQRGTHCQRPSKVIPRTRLV